MTTRGTRLGGARRGLRRPDRDRRRLRHRPARRRPDAEHVRSCSWRRSSAGRSHGRSDRRRWHRDAIAGSRCWRCSSPGGGRPRPARACGSTRGPRAASSRSSTTSARSSASLVPLQFLFAVPIAWASVRDERRRPASGGRPPTTITAIVGVVDEWWGGRRVQRCCRTSGSSISPGRRGSPSPSDGRLVGFLVGFISPDHPGDARTSTWSARTRTSGAPGSAGQLYERFFEDAARARRAAGHRRHLARQPDLGRVPHRDRLPARRRPGHAAALRHARPTRTTTATARTGSASRDRELDRARPHRAGVSCSRRSRPKRAARSAAGTASTQRRRSASPSA